MSVEAQTAIIPSADLPDTTAIINQSGATNNNVNQSNSSSVSPSRSRRRRKRNNRNKNKNETDSKSNDKVNTKSNKKRKVKPKAKTKAKPQSVQSQTNQTKNVKLDRVALSKKSKKNPWSKKQKSSAFENIMSEQRESQKPNYKHSQTQITEQQLLEQQMVEIAIAASKKEQHELQLKEYEKYSKKDNNKQCDEEQLKVEQEKAKEQENQENQENKENEDTKNIKNEDDEKQIIIKDKDENESKESTLINDELIAATINAQSNIGSKINMEDQTISDQALAIQLQREEEHEFNRRVCFHAKYEFSHEFS